MRRTDRRLYAKGDKTAEQVLHVLGVSRQYREGENGSKGGWVQLGPDDDDLGQILAYHVQRLFERAGWGKAQAIATVRDVLTTLEQGERPAK